MSVLTFVFWPLIRYKWLRGQRETVGKSICIHLSLLSAVESANYFSAGLKALSLFAGWQKGARPSSARNAGRMTNDVILVRQRLNDKTGRKLIETDDKKSNGAKNEGWNIM